MTIHLSSAVIHGHLSNTLPGLITGQIHLAGSATPLEIQLAGDFLRDIAGCRVEFANPLPEALPGQHRLSSRQTGPAGELTGSRRMFRAPRQSAPKAPLPASGLKNLVFFEWFNEQGQRVVVQSWHWNLRVSAPAWHQSRDQEQAQIKRSRALRKRFLLNRPRRQKPESPFGQANPGPTTPESPPQPDPEVLRERDRSRKGPAPKPDGLESYTSAALSAQIAARALAAELCDLESHLGVVPRVKAREAMLDLLASISDIAGQLRQTMFQIATTKPDRWAPLATDVEQSIPLFVAAGAACEGLVSEGELSHPGWWNSTCSHLAAIVAQAEALFDLLRADGR